MHESPLSGLVPPMCRRGMLISVKRRGTPRLGDERHMQPYLVFPGHLSIRIAARTIDRGAMVKLHLPRDEIDNRIDEDEVNVIVYCPGHCFRDT